MEDSPRNAGMTYQGIILILTARNPSPNLIQYSMAFPLWPDGIHEYITILGITNSWSLPDNTESNHRIS
jgi:hypothetical protein